MTFDEFNSITGQKVYVSATPSDYELERSDGLVVEQVVRPTGLLDPPIEVRPTKNQVDDLVEEMLDALEGKEHHCEFDGVNTILTENGKYCAAPVTHRATLGYIVD